MPRKGDATATQPDATAPRRGCSATTTAGAPCRGFAQRDSDYCLLHDPASRDAARAARAKGGAAAGKLRALQSQRQSLDSVDALVRFTSGVILDVVDGTLSPDIARVALYGCATMRQFLESGDLERRLAALEAAQTQIPTRRTTWP